VLRTGKKNSASFACRRQIKTGYACGFHLAKNCCAIKHFAAGLFKTQIKKCNKNNKYFAKNVKVFKKKLNL
jgi:hypothetical protein